jgi:ABC-type phosphate transport system permease subunit
MGFLNTFLELLGFGIGLPFGLLIGFFLFVYSKPKDTVKVINRVSSSLSLVLSLSLSLSLYNPYVLVCWFF